MKAPEGFIKKDYPLKSVVVLLLSFLGTELMAQNIPLGTWRSHTSYRRAINLTGSPERLFCTTEFGLFFIELSDGSLNTITTNDEISSVNFSEIEYIELTNTLLITYEDGDLDFWRDNELTNFNVIAESNIIGSRNINDIQQNEGLVYLSTDFGVVVIEPVEIEVEEAYTGLGVSGEQIPINGSAFFQDTVFLAANTGVISASLSPLVNRLDFNVYERREVNGNSPVSAIENFQNQLFATIDNDFVYRYFNGEWIQTAISVNGEVAELKAIQEVLYLTTNEDIIEIRSPEVAEPLENDGVEQPGSIELINNRFFIADFNNGVIELNGEEFNSFIPPGPIFNNTVDLFSINETTLAVHGSKTSSDVPANIPGGFSLFQNGGWSTFESPEQIPFIQDLVSVNFNNVTSRAQFSSFGFGFLDWDFAQEFNIINENTPGSTLVNNDPQGNQTFITDIKNDAEGNLWMANFNSPIPLHRLTPQGEWQGFTFDFPQSEFPEELIITSSGDIWMSLRNSGILVFNPETGESRRLTNANANLPSQVVNGMIEDLDGQVWVATNGGVAVFSFIFDIINNPSAEAFVPIIEGLRLFEDEIITDIIIDGGNRKWMTTSNGAFLFNEQVSELELSFNSQNSPLLSNNIMDLSIDNSTGEIFMATDRGLISYRGTSTFGTDNHEDVQVFPNPITSGFNGLVGFRGLANDVNLKITDVSGKLVREVIAEGGTASWDIRDLNGRRVETGVYLIFSSTQDGNESFAGKFAVIE